MDESKTYIKSLKISDVPWHRLTMPYGRATEFPTICFTAFIITHIK